jgi:hypothetical protein
MDECGVELATADRSIGKAYIGKRVKQSGLYSKSDKWTLLLAISGHPNGRRWQNLWTGEGTTGDRMVSFLTMILEQLGPGTAGKRFCFIMDNLSVTIYFYGRTQACISSAILSDRWPNRVCI